MGELGDSLPLARIQAAQQLGEGLVIFSDESEREATRPMDEP